MNTLLGTMAPIVLFGSVILRHEYRHREAEQSLATKVRERTADLEGSLAERDILMREIHHRVRNNLQIVASLVSLSAGDAGDGPGRAFVDRSMQRIQSMALVHETLYDTDRLDRLDLSIYARKLVDFAKAGARAQLRVEFQDDVEVGLDFAVPFGLLLNELVGLAIGRAEFELSGGAAIVVRIERTDCLRLSVLEEGALRQQPAVSEGRPRGHDIVEAMARQLGARVSARLGPSAGWTVSFPPDALGA